MFEAKKAQGKKVLITFVTAGDPDIETTCELVLAMERAGADLIEIGIPFSDPVAEGPVIQAANIRALAQNTKIIEIFAAVAKLRTQTGVPIVYLTYLNSVFKFGTEKFFKKCAEVGVDGVIIPDLPFEERDEIHEEAHKNGVCHISLITPTSNERIEKIASSAEGFLYCVSSLGVTGTRSSFETDFTSFFEKVNKHATAPTALGFGISTPEQVKMLKKYSDGLIVGSAIVKKIGEAKSKEEALESVTRFVRELSEAIN